MPFDTKLRQPTVTILPPTPPERAEGPRRIRIEIEIVDRRKPVQTQHRFGTFTLWLLALLLLSALAHAEDRAVSNSLHYDHWESTSGWQGETRTQGSTTDWDAYGPDGRQKHCHRYFVGDTAYTTCRRSQERPLSQPYGSAGDCALPFVNGPHKLRLVKPTPSTSHPTCDKPNSRRLFSPAAVRGRHTSYQSPCARPV